MLHAQSHNFRLKNFDDIYGISQRLADYFLQPEQLMTGIYELLLNAVEHGNLGLGYELKSELLRRGLWQEEIERRMALPHNSGKAVDITMLHDHRECRLSIADQGKGFAWKNYLQCSQDFARPNGRGLLIAFGSQFQRIAFNCAGNEVTCVAPCRRRIGATHPRKTFANSA